MACSNMRFRVVPCQHYDDVSFYRNRFKIVSFPCGKCADCTKARQNDIAVRAGYESMCYSEISFCRLSYANESLPLSYVPFIVFADGTKVQDGEPKLLDGPFLEQMRKVMANVPNSIIKGKSRYIHYRPEGFEGIYGEGSYVEYTITPSVNLRDPRLWLKSCRVEFKRKFGYALPDCKYLMCAEYGEQYTRPHYHYLFLGLKPWIVDWMLARWEAKYGQTNRKSVRNTPQDKFRVSSYVSKYMAKGDFEVPAVKAGIALKGRYCASRALGRYIIEDKRPHFLAYDLYGRYDPDTLVLENGKELTLSQQKSLVDVILSRMSVQVPGMDYRFPLPRSWKYLMYYKKLPRKAAKIEVICEGKSDVKFYDSYRYVPYKIFRLVQKTVQDRTLSDDLRECQQFAMSLPSGTSYVEANFRFKAFKEARAKNSESHSREALRAFYAKDSQ